jgi:hypothetical protein
MEITMVVQEPLQTMALELVDKEIVEVYLDTTQAAEAEELHKKGNHLTEDTREVLVESEHLILETHTQEAEAAEATTAQEQLR